VPGDAELERRLAETTLALVDIPSESRREAAAAAWVEAAVPVGALRLVHRDDETLLYLSKRRPGAPLAVLAGHLDTVPEQGNLPGRIADGWVHGLGASDMKGGVAVLVELARKLGAATGELAVDVGLLFFPREELPQEESALPGLFAACAAVREADLVVLLEPTDNELHLGCLGNLTARLVFHGESAHSARPWTGTNAIERAVAGLARVLPVPPREVEIEGLRFVEVASATGIAGGIATNVVPDRATCVLNFRYAPDRSPASAEEHVRGLGAAAGADEVEIAGNSQPAPVVADTPLVHRLREAGGFALAPKQAWTPVAEFAAAGLAAVNLGPGATRYAHKRDERVEIAELVRTFTALYRFVTEPVGRS
jgi:succinyl-diaminopimelate desuccinylase